MKKRLVLLSVILTLLVGFSQKTFSVDKKLIPLSNYMEIQNASYVCDEVDFRINIGGPGVTVTIYNNYNNPVHSFSVPYAGFYLECLDGPAGTYYAVLTGNGIYEKDYFTKVCN